MMSLTDLENLVRNYKAAGYSKMELRIVTVEDLLKEARRAQGPLSLHDEAKKFQSRRTAP